MNKNSYKQVISFWFAPETQPKWFIKNEEFDQEITEKFQELYMKATSDKLGAWQKFPEGTLALIIILDQFPRNMFRGTAKAFATDNKALELTKYAIKNSYDQKLTNEQKQFLYMPLMHSENLEDQNLSVKLFAFNSYALEYAKAHHHIIKQFGRFPHRNNILGRKSTNEELEFLKQPNSSF
jgi:uncharacterized protein (DUF924 family)